AARHPALGRSVRSRGHRVGDAYGRLAHRAHDGHAHHEVEAGRRLLRGDGRGHHARIRYADGRAGLYDSHNHGRNRRRRRDAATVGCEVGRRRPNRLGVDSHDTARGTHLRALLHGLQGPQSPLALLLVEFPPGVQVVEVEYGVEDEEVAAVRLAAPDRVVREEQDVAAPRGHVYDRGVLRYLAAAIEQP